MRTIARDIYQATAALRNSENTLTPMAGIRVTVYLAGTTTIANIYQGATGSTQGPRTGSGASGGPNPFLTGASGAIEFYADAPLAYDIRVEDTVIPGRISADVFTWNADTGADNAMPGSKLVDNTVTGVKLQDASVTNAKLAAALKPSGGAAAGTEALRALGTTAGTAAAGDDARLSNQRVPTDLSVTTAKIADGAVTAVKVAADVATQAELDAVNSAHNTRLNAVEAFDTAADARLDAIEAITHLGGVVSSAGAKVSGVGAWSVTRTAAGQYSVLFSPGFSAPPGFGLQQVGGTQMLWVLTTLTAVRADLTCAATAGGAGVDRGFAFTAIGPAA